MTAAPGRSTQQLGEFLAAVSVLGTATAAARGAVERAAEALGAEVAAIVVAGEVIASVGYPAGRVPAGGLEAVAAGCRGELDLPGFGPCQAVAIPLDHPPQATLVVARAGPEGLSAEEIGVLDGMARATSMALRILGLLDEERMLRAQSERQAAEVARLLAELTERQATLERLANEQAALRRVATLVARGLPPEAVFAAVAEEVSQLAAAELVQMFRYEPDGSAVRVATSGTDAAELPIAVVGAPILVEGRLWGAVLAGTTRPEPMPADAEERIAGFTELVATAIANTQARADLAASRLRVVAAGDEMRRRIERNLHDGTQQRLVTVALKLRSLHDKLPDGLPDLDDELSEVEGGVAAVLDELREISRGLHPPILSEYGLGPTLRSLARRAALPVELEVGVPKRLPESVESAAYYLVSEALANAAKHAGAASAEVSVVLGSDRLTVRIRDDGVGGADPARGSGLIGLRDRIEAMGGTMVLTSSPGQGTTLLVELPLGEP